ncbi:MAG: hypothetical protein ACR2PT_03730 [Endozoicomonas sp.]
MPLEQRVTRVESKFDTLDHSFRELLKVVRGTQDVVALILKKQEELEKNAARNQQENRERFDQLELLIRQHFTTG